MPTATIDGVRLSYQTAGHGAPVLLIMGLAMPGEGWRRQIADLSADHELCWYDNRGIGGSDSPPGLYTTRRLARDGLGLMDHLGWSSAHVVGISMGGMIAQHLAMLAPRRVRSLSLIATHAGGRGGLWGMLGQLAAALTHMSRRRLHQLRGIPTLVVTGTGDILVRPHNSRTIAERLGGRLVEIPKAGHGVTIEAEAQVNRALREHMAYA